MQDIRIDLDRSGKAGSIAVDGEKVKRTTDIALSSEFGVGNYLKIEGHATAQTIRAVIALLERLVEGATDPDALRAHFGGVTIDGYPLADLDSVSLIIDRDATVRLIVEKRVEELALTLHSRRGN